MSKLTLKGYDINKKTADNQLITAVLVARTGFEPVLPG